MPGYLAGSCVRPSGPSKEKCEDSGRLSEITVAGQRLQLTLVVCVLENKIEGMKQRN
jgi:predicted ester cyclase